MLSCPSPGSFSDYVEDKMLRHILGFASWSPPTSLVAALGAGTPELGTFVELEGKGYERIPIRFINPPVTGDWQSYTLSKYKLVFGPALVDWDPVNTVVILDGDTDEVLTSGPLLSNWYVKEDQQLILKRKEVAAGMLPTSSGVPGWWSRYLQEQVVKHVYLGIAYAQPTIYAALSDRKPDPDDTGSTIVEPSDSAYGRVEVPEWTTPVGQFTGHVSSIVNPNSVSFGTATVNWFGGADVANWPVFLDAAEDGNWLFTGHSSIDRHIWAGERAVLGQTSCSLD